MDTQEFYVNKMGEWDNRSRFDLDESIWEHEGKYMELEKRLRKGGEQQLSKHMKLTHGHHEDAEREPDYERAERSRLQDESRGHALQGATEKTRKHPVSKAGDAQATDWQDFGDYEPGYSGHQISGQRGRGMLSSKDTAREGGKRIVSGENKKTDNRSQERRGKLHARRAAGNRATSPRRS